MVFRTSLHLPIPSLQFSPTAPYWIPLIGTKRFIPGQVWRHTPLLPELEGLKS